MFIELHAQSAFSFLEGVELPETLVAEAAKREMGAIALLDRDGVYGAPRLHRAAVDAGIKALVGAEVTLVGGARGPLAAAVAAGDREAARASLDRLVGIFGPSNCFVEVQRHLDRRQERDLQRLVALARERQVPLLAT